MNPVLAKLEARSTAANTLVCIGLDPELAAMPAHLRAEPEPLFAFNRFLIDATAPFAAAFKPNAAFYEAHGAHGIDQLHRTFDYIHANHPGIVTIYDAKRGDNANTNRGYVLSAFDDLHADCITLHPYLGREALAPFLDRADKACILLCRTSNPGAGDLQDLLVGDIIPGQPARPLWQAVAEKVTRSWDVHGNCMLVVGATYPEEMRALRSLAPHTTFLVPGVGAQGGDIEAVVAAGLDARGRGLLISSSRAIAEAASPATAARDFRDAINAARAKVHHAAR